MYSLNLIQNMGVIVHFDFFSTVPEAQMAHEEDILIFSVGVTTEIDRQVLANLSSPPQQEGVNWFVATNFEALSSIEEQITDEACDIIVST